MISRTVKWVGQVARMGRWRIYTRFQLEKLKGRGRLGDPTAEDDIRNDCKKYGPE